MNELSVMPADITRRMDSLVSYCFKQGIISYFWIIMTGGAAWL